MKNSIFLIFCSLFIIPITYAQSYDRENYEIGFSVGVANYLGDLAKNEKPWFFGETQGKAFRPAVGVFYRSNFHKFLSFRAGMNVAQLYGNDALSSPGTGREGRNLHFRSNVLDVTMMLEWNILPYKIGHYKYRFTPYIGFGVGGFYFNPKAKLNGDWVNLQELGTEGQGLIEYPNRTKYSKIALNIPISFGGKLNVGRNWAIGMELQYRHTFTDYIDDVSTVYPNLDYYDNNYITAIADEARALSYRGDNLDTSNLEDRKRGNSDKSDAYFFVLFNVSCKIGGNKNYCPKFR